MEGLNAKDGMCFMDLSVTARMLNRSPSGLNPVVPSECLQSPLSLSFLLTFYLLSLLFLLILVLVVHNIT